MECEGSAFTHMKKRFLSSLYQRENSENSLLISLFVFCKKKRPEAKRRFFLSSSALLQLVRSEPQNNGKEGKFYRLLIFFTPNIIIHARALTHTHAHTHTL